LWLLMACCCGGQLPMLTMVSYMHAAITLSTPAAPSQTCLHQYGLQYQCSLKAVHACVEHCIVVPSAA